MKRLEAYEFDRGELDKRLKELALTAQQQPLQSAERQFALTELYAIILDSKKLWYPPKNRFIQDAYDEAKQELWWYVCKFIEKYDPEKGSVIAWVNTMLDRRFYSKALAEIIVRQQNQCLEDRQYKENTSSLLEQVWDYIELDPENIFKQEYIEGHPDANFRALILYRCSDTMWKDISRLLGIKSTTLIRFYQRCLKKFAKKIRDYLTY